MSENLKEILTVIEQGGNYILKTGGYNTHLSIDGKHFAKTTELVVNYEPKTVEIGTDKHEPDYWSRTINDKNERLDNEDYQFMRNNINSECLDEDGNYLSLEHEYKQRKALNGWVCTYKDWIEWKEFSIQILHLPKIDNPLITGYLSSEKIDNPVVNYNRNKQHIVIEAFNRIGIDIMSCGECNSYSGVPGKLTRRTSSFSPKSDLYEVYYDDKEIVDYEDFKRPSERVTLEEALYLFEQDIESVIKRYEKAYAFVNAKITEDNGRKLAEALSNIQQSLQSLPVYAKSVGDKNNLIIKVKKAKSLLGIE